MSKSLLIKLGLLVLAFALIPALLVGFDKGYYYQIATIAAIFMLLAASLHLVTGVAGLLHLGHAALYGVGAYVAAILGANHGIGFTLGLPLAGLSAAAIAFLVALPGHGEPVDELQARGILLDGTTENGEPRLLLQIFSETVFGPVFFEFIQRKQDDGFGEGNFKALFESIERDQLSRGVLKDKAS